MYRKIQAVPVRIRLKDRLVHALVARKFWFAVLLMVLSLRLYQINEELISLGLYWAPVIDGIFLEELQKNIGSFLGS
jgi:hypothetical protein